VPVVLPSPPGYRLAIRALVFAIIGPFVMAASSPAAIVLGWRSMRQSAGASPHAKGRASAAGAIALGTFGVLFWMWAVWRLWVKLDQKGKDPHLVVPLAVALFAVWVASGFAGALSFRAHRAT
jgi:hypothetical protein